MTRIKIFFLSLLTLSGFILGACVNASAIAPATPTPASIQPVATANIPTLAAAPLAKYFIPPYYDPGYQKVIDAAQSEPELVIYSEFDSSQWVSVLSTFKSHYPWINVRFVSPELGVFEQYDFDMSAGLTTADMIVSTDTVAWYELLLRGEIQAYQSQENLYLPLWATKNVGLYPMSLDPAVIVYYKNLVSTPPINMLALSNIIRRSPENYYRNIATIDANSNPEALLVNWFWIKAKGDDGWDLLERIYQVEPTIYTNKNELMQNIINSTVRIGYFVPASSVIPEKKRYTNLEFSYIKDGQPIYMNYKGITRLAQHPNSAKLLLDFLLSQDGQIALAQDGFMPYRSDISSVLDYHLEILENFLGTENLIFMDVNPVLNNPDNVTPFLERWNSTYSTPE